jgi:hypothetical protein
MQLLKCCQCRHITLLLDTWLKSAAVEAVPCTYMKVLKYYTLGQPLIPTREASAQQVLNLMCAGGDANGPRSMALTALDSSPGQMATHGVHRHTRTRTTGLYFYSSLGYACSGQPEAHS